MWPEQIKYQACVTCPWTCLEFLYWWLSLGRDVLCHGVLVPLVLSSAFASLRWIQRFSIIKNWKRSGLDFTINAVPCAPPKSLVNSLYCKWAAKVVYRKPFSKAMVSEFPSCCSMRQSEHRFPLQQCLHQLLGYGCSCLDVGQRLDMDSCCTELGIKTINVCWTTSQLKEVRTFFCLSLSQGHSLDDCSVTSSFICNSAKLHFQWATCLQWL